MGLSDDLRRLADRLEHYWRKPERSRENSARLVNDYARQAGRLLGAAIASGQLDVADILGRWTPPRDERGRDAGLFWILAQNWLPTVGTPWDGRDFAPERLGDGVADRLRAMADALANLDGDVRIPYDPRVLERVQKIWEAERLTPEQRDAQREMDAILTQAEVKLGLVEPKTAEVVSGGWSAADSPSRWAKRFGVSLDTLKRRIADGIYNVQKDSSRLWRFPVNEIPADK